uniref:Uncharacterized protein n=1 Tax=Steinernema glaseri TaxID=37863 RepID=A0A1I7ZDG9_9BILA
FPTLFKDMCTVSFS